MEGLLEDLWYRLITLDNTWQLAYCWYDKVVLINGAGQEIHADTQESALRAAIAMSEPKTVGRWE